MRRVPQTLPDNYCVGPGGGRPQHRRRFERVPMRIGPGDRHASQVSTIWE